MKNKCLYPFLLLMLISNSFRGQINPKDTLDRYILRQMNYFGTPGLELAIVQDYKDFSNMIRALYPKHDIVKRAARNLLMASRKKIQRHL